MGITEGNQIMDRSLVDRGHNHISDQGTFSNTSDSQLSEESCQLVLTLSESTNTPVLQPSFSEGQSEDTSRWPWPDTGSGPRVQRSDGQVRHLRYTAAMAELRLLDRDNFGSRS